MDRVIWLVILIPLSLLFTGIGIYARCRKQPMWFWSGSTVRAEEITDVRAYNRANGIMWLCYSAVFWISAVMGLFQVRAAAVVMTCGCVGGVPLLIFAYNSIYKKYRKK